MDAAIPTPMDRAAPLSPIRRRSINLITGLYNRLPRPLAINARALRYIQFQFYLKENTLPLIQKTKYVMMLEEKIAVPCEKHTGKKTPCIYKMEGLWVIKEAGIVVTTLSRRNKPRRTSAL